MMGMSKSQAGQYGASPTQTEKKSRDERISKALRSAEEEFVKQLAVSARYLVTHNGYIVAAFANVDDALMFEGDLADVDAARMEAGATCEVLDRKGRRHGGYFVTGTKVVSYLA